MKTKIIGILMLFLFVSISQAFGLNKTNESFENIDFNFTFSKPKIEKITINDELLDRIIISDLPNTNDYEKPRLPVKSIRVLLPYGKDVESIDVITSDKTSFGNGYNVEEGGLLVPLICAQKQIDTSVTKNSVSHSFEESYSFGGVYKCRGYPILHVNLYPVQYDGETGEIYYYENIQLVVSLKNSIISKSVRGLQKDQDIVREIVVNPDYLSTYVDNSVSILNNDEIYDYVIITDRSLKNANGQYTFQDLVEAKRSQGFNPIIVTVGEIILNPDYRLNGAWGDNNIYNPFYQRTIIQNTDMFDDTSARIRNFIRYAYMEWGTDFVLLAGDADEMNKNDNIIPLRGLFANETGLPLDGLLLSEEEDDIPSDVYYACLDGCFNFDMDEHFGECTDKNDLGEIDEADLYSEVWVGRACVDSDEEVSNFVMKTIEYEQSNDPYVSEILFVGEYLGEAFYYPYGGYYKDDMEYLVPSQYNVHKFYDLDHSGGHWYPDELINEIYAIEPQIINHDGHGNCHYMLKMGSRDVYEIQNEKPFFIYSHSCLTGSFDNWDCWSGYQEDDCIAEILTCEIPYGAYACILNARYGLGSEYTAESPSGNLDESFYEALFTENIKQLGPASHYSKEDNAWRIDENGIRWCYYQTNLFGDPSLAIKDPTNQAPDKPLKPSGPANGKVGEEYTFTSSATDSNDDQIYYLFDWGDGSNSGWLGPYASGAEVSAKHIWNDENNFQIMVLAKDTSEQRSTWSDPLSISLPRNKNMKILFLFEIFEMFKAKITIIQKLINVEV